MKADKKLYKCPKCDYVTHFEPALKAHMNFRKHFPVKKPEKPPVQDAAVTAPDVEKEMAAEIVKVIRRARKITPPIEPTEEVIVSEEVKEKKVRKPRTRKTADKGVKNEI